MDILTNNLIDVYFLQWIELYIELGYVGKLFFYNYFRVWLYRITQADLNQFYFYLAYQFRIHRAGHPSGDATLNSSRSNFRNYCSVDQRTYSIL